MNGKPNLLIVGDFNRKDYIDNFRKCAHDFNFYFAEYVSDKEVYSTYYKQLGAAVYWSNFKDAFELLAYIKPKKVVFFYVESYFHVALLLACKARRLPTIHLEHGIRDYNINVRLAQALPTHIGPSKFKHYLHVLTQLKERLKGRLFLLNTKKRLPDPEAKEFIKFITLRKHKGYLETIITLNTDLLWPDVSVSYSQKVFEVHDYYLKLLPVHKVRYIGIPAYDNLATIKLDTLNRNLLFIDQGLSNRNYFDWNKKNFELLLKSIVSIAQTKNLKLFIKPHPTHLEFKKLYGKLLTPNAHIIHDDELKTTLTQTSIILGFFSTLLLPLAAMPHTTLITLENHPVGRLDVSKSFVDAGVAHPIYSLDELPDALDNIEELHKKQLPNKKKFEEEWLYKFDGKAGERLRNILLSDEL